MASFKKLKVENMNENLNVRSMLVDKTTGKYIKAIDEVGLDDFVHCLTRSKEPSYTIPDFQKLIDYQHEHLNMLLQSYRDEELQVKRNQVYNVWMRLKSLTNDNLKVPVVCDVMSKSEEVSGWLHFRMKRLVDEYHGNNTFQASFNGWHEQKTALKSILAEVEAFIEVILCNIHSTSSLDIASLRHDTVITGHCVAVYELLKRMVQKELSHNGRQAGHDSFIYHLIMEDVGINPDAFLNLIYDDVTPDLIKSKLLESTEVTNQEEQWGSSRYRVKSFSYSYAIADEHLIDRVKEISLVLQRIASILELLKSLKGNDYNFDKQGSRTAEFEQDFELLCSERLSV
ncbi:TPA: hypothetical protein ACPVZ0_004463 [Vibrio parahaemolyticus]